MPKSKSVYYYCFSLTIGLAAIGVSFLHHGWDALGDLILGVVLVPYSVGKLKMVRSEVRKAKDL